MLNPKRKQQRRNSLWKQGKIYARAAFAALIALACVLWMVHFGALLIYYAHIFPPSYEYHLAGVYRSVFPYDIFLPTPLLCFDGSMSDKLLLFCFIGILAWLGLTMSRKVLEAKKDAFRLSVLSPLQVDTLPAEAVLVRAATQPPATSDTLLRAASEGIQRQAEQLLRSSEGDGEMTFKESGESPKRGWLDLLSAAARIAALVGAAGSVGLTVWAGRRNHSLLLMLLFTLWVLSPFLALIRAHQVSKRWAVLTRGALYSLMLLLTLISLVLYGAVAVTPPKKPAFVFLAVPLASWLLIAILVPVSAFLSGRRAPKGP